MEPLVKTRKCLYLLSNTSIIVHINVVLLLTVTRMSICVCLNELLEEVKTFTKAEQRV